MNIIQSKLLNLKSLGLEVLFRIISSSNNMVVGKKIYYPLNDYYQLFFYFKYKFWACKINVSMRCFFYAPKTYVIIGSY